MTSSEAQNPSSSRWTFLSVLALLAVSFMLFQLAILRELRYQLTTSLTLTPFLFSSVIFFIAAGSLAAARVGPNSKKILRLGVLLLPVLLLPAFALMLLDAQGQLDSASSGRFVSIIPIEAPASGHMRLTIFAFIAVGVGGYGIIFILQGLIFALYFREAREDGILSDVYGVDLLASGAGALLGGSLAFVLTPIQTILVSEALFLAALWMSRRLLGIRLLHAGLATAVGAALLVAELGGGVLTRLEDPGFFTELSYSHWSRYRRIDAEEQPVNLAVYADGLLFQMHDRRDTTHHNDPRRFPVQVIQEAARPLRDVLIIGAGSGADVRILRDVLGDRLNITAVELDQGFVDTARQSPWLWKSFSSAEIVVQEGRYFLENSRRDFDLIIYGFVDPQSASGNIGLPDANFLYTDAGFRSALARVREGGCLLVSRVYLEAEEKDFMGRTCAALKNAGVAKDQVRFYRDLGSSPWGLAGRLTASHFVVGKGVSPPELRHYGIRPLAWVDGGTAPTDMFPYAFGTGIWFETLLACVTGDAVLLVLGAALLLGILISVGTSKGRATLFALGFGSFMLESLVLFNSFLLFGDPNLSAAVAVGVFLLWSGVGSLFSQRLEKSRGLRVALPLAILLYAVTAPLLNAWMIATPVPLRLLVFVLHASLGGIAAGMAFPAALRSFPANSVPILFFVDVMGCALAPPLFWLAMNAWGLWMVILFVTISYGAVSLVLMLRQARLAG